MDMPSASWVNLALQIPLALVIVVLVVYFLRYLEKMAAAVLDFLKQQSDVNREFMRTQQEMHNQAIARLAEEIKSHRVDTVKELANLTQRVDGVIDKAIMLERLLPDKNRGS